MDTQGEITYASVKEIIGKTGKHSFLSYGGPTGFSVYLWFGLAVSLSFIAEFNDGV